MPIPQFILDLRRHVGTAPLWLSGVTAIVLRPTPGLPVASEHRELLMVRRSDNGRWTPVTGIVDPGEHPAVAAVREVAEEACVTARVERLVWVSTTPLVTHVNGDRARYLDHCFLCTWEAGEPAVGDDESTDARWFPLGDLPPMQPVFRDRLAVALADEVACHLGESAPALPAYVRVASS
ncbi:NUDIX hydrolase [Kytococcus sp. Marseille-QA3725]